MNFFEHQAQARRSSKRLVLLFLLAVVAMVLAIDAAVVIAFEFINDKREHVAEGPLLARYGGALAATSIIVLLTVALSSLYKTAKLRSGGGVVARSLGGTLITSENTNPAYRRLRNVVEEIAIASGVPVPELYVLEQEPGINAFAAGWSPSDAAVTVTRGALDHLNRDELQGVIAHEFSHVLNGDMRLNIRLMGILFGILVIGVVAREFLLRSRVGNNKNAGAIVLVALAVMIIGYVGLFFGRLIKAGISRQREYLADASAVQFTRQNLGIAGALKKIGALAEGSKFQAANGEEVSHMLFGDGVGYSALFATHPPLAERIKRIQGGRFDPRELDDMARSFAQRGIGGGEGASEALAAADGVAAGFSGGAAAGPTTTGRERVQVTPDGVVQQVARPTNDDYMTAAQIAAAIPERLRTLAYMREYCAELVLALALDPDPTVRATQLEVLGNTLGGGSASQVAKLAEETDALHPLQRLPLAALAFPSLRRHPRAELERFVQVLTALIHADGRIHLTEYCLAKLVALQVTESLDPSRVRAGKLKTTELRDEIAAVMAVLALHGAIDANDAERAYLAGVAVALPSGAPPFAPAEDWPTALDGTIAKMQQLSPAAKQLVVEGLVRTMSHDNQVTVPEAELLRTVCSALHCPLPPQIGT
ncbi:MAG TPA: M48 family metallopeptidase [Xanthomonadales bacterium]|nr:M48 family metallopeptidase [Xanthomonadales bacterium]